MNTTILEISILFILMIANGLLAMAEIAVVSARKARLQQQAESGDEQARAALDLANDPANFLATVQIGITLVGVLAGAFGGATIADHIHGWLEQYPSLAPYAGPLSILMVVIPITYFSLVIGELAPKRLALSNPERTAAAAAGPMRVLSRIAAPLVKLLNLTADLILKLIGFKNTNEAGITEEEIKVMLEQGAQEGVFAEAEQEMVEAVFRLADRRLGSLMTPRTEVVWLDLDDPQEANRRILLESRYSRFPVGRGSLDNVIGLVQARDLLEQCIKNEPLDLESAVVPAIFLPESTPALQVLDLMRARKMHIVVVIDEFGGVQGIVTAFDLLEAIVGDIPDVGDKEEPEIVRREDGSWLIDGMLPVDEFREILRLPEMPGEVRGYYQTLGGFVMTRLGRIPNASDHFEWNGLRFEVVDMDGLRVDKVLVSPLDEGYGGSFQPGAQKGD